MFPLSSRAGSHRKIFGLNNNLICRYYLKGEFSKIRKEEEKEEKEPVYKVSVFMTVSCLSICFLTLSYFTNRTSPLQGIFQKIRIWLEKFNGCTKLNSKLYFPYQIYQVKGCSYKRDDSSTLCASPPQCISVSTKDANPKTFANFVGFLPAILRCQA